MLVLFETAAGYAVFKVRPGPAACRRLVSPFPGRAGLAPGGWGDP